MITIIDYGMSNLRSVAKAFELAGAHNVCISSKPSDIISAEKIILPGQGGFPDGMRNLKVGGLIKPLQDTVLNKKKPLLGICLGMQILADSSTEFKKTSGLGFIPGEVKLLDVDTHKYKLPHVGWDDVTIVNKACPLVTSLPNNPDFYFVHSYVFALQNNAALAAKCTYGKSFPAIIWRENIFATLFHPEKSQKNGLTVIKNFLKL